MPAADFPRSLHVRREMHVQTAFWNQPLCIDGRDVFLSGAVPENIRRDFFLQFYIYRDGMSLVRTDQRVILIEGIALFFIRTDNLLQCFHV